MKPLANTNVRGFAEAVAVAQAAGREGRTAAFAGGGSDLLVLVKEGIASPDLLVNLKGIADAGRIEDGGTGLVIGGLATLAAIGRHAGIRQRYAVLADAASTVATPQIRNVGTLAGNVCQRPWCWYFRNGFPCFKAGGRTCFSPSGENQFHAIFGGGPSYIVHPSDTAPALVALGATFRIMGPSGERRVPAAEFFVLPRQNVAQENVLGVDEVLTAVEIPPGQPGTRSAYGKVMDREAWTHAVVSAAVVLRIDQGICRTAQIVLGGVAPIPWRVAEAESLLAGQRITADLAAKVGQAAVAGATPLPRNQYKVPLTSALVTQTLRSLAPNV